MAEVKKPESRIITDLRATLLKDRTIEFAKKTVEHQMKKDLLQFKAESIQRKQKTLDQEKQNWEEMKEKLFSLENDYCETVWKFSRQHDFGNFLINYPRIKTPIACNCEFYKKTAETVEKELQENAEIQKLTREVDCLKLELETLANDKNLEEIKKASKELKFDSEDDEIQRLTKVLQNSQQELEFLQTEIENNLQKEDLLSNILEINSSPAKKKKRTTKEEKSSEKLDFTKKTPRVIKNPPLTCPNTIDNYLIVKRKKGTPEEKTPQKEDKKLIDKSKISIEINHQEKSGILGSWTRNSDDNISFTNIENSIKEACSFLDRTKKCPPRKILCKSPMKPEIEVFQKTKFFYSNPSIVESPKLKSLVAERKSNLRSFTPKKQSAIAEKLLKKQ